MKKRLVAAMMVAAMCTSLFCGCGASEKQETVQTADGKIEIEFYSSEDLEKIVDLLTVM